MPAPHKKIPSKARALKNRSLPRILLLGLFYFLVRIPEIGSTPKKAQVNISKEDVARANEALTSGDIAFSRKDYYAALIKYLEAVRLNPQSDYLYNRLGIAYSQLKFYGEATAAFRRCIELNPKYPFAYNNLGSVFFAQGNLRKAEKYFKKAISLKDNEGSFHRNLGSLYLDRKKKDKALAEWRKCLAIDPDIFSKPSAISLSSSGGSMIERYFFMARILAASGNVDAAIENLKLAITQGFTDIESINKQPDFDAVRNDDRFIEFMQNAALLIQLQSKAGLPASEQPGFPPRK
jgi:tetratricopeptide (TPR) repeat protein